VRAFVNTATRMPMKPHTTLVITPLKNAMVVKMAECQLWMSPSSSRRTTPNTDMKMPIHLQAHHSRTGSTQKKGCW